MALQALYTGLSVKPAFCLRYSWTGWPTGPTFVDLPCPDVLEVIVPPWKKDGLRLLEYHWSDEQIQLTFSARPKLTPEFLARRAKGRLQDALRKTGQTQQFSRKLSVRSVGDNTTRAVEEYIRSQVGKELFVDPEFAERMKQFTVNNPDIDLSVATRSARGNYWYNLHVVLVVLGRSPIRDFVRLGAIRDGCIRIADKKGYGISTLSAMLNHLHLALRGDPGQSPQEIALAFQNNLAYMLGQEAIWQENFYVGTFSEYDMWAIRKRIQRERNCST